MSLPEIEPHTLPQLPEPVAVEMPLVERRIQQGDFLLIVAGDRLDPRAVRLGRALLGDHLVNQWELALVEVAVFARAEGALGPEHLLVPHIQGAIETELRQVVKVEVVQGDRNRVVVERATSPSLSGGRERWDEQRFFSALDASPLPRVFKEFGHGLLSLREEFPGTVLTWGTGKNGSATLKRHTHGLVEFYLDGRLGFRTRRIPQALGPVAGEAYLTGVRRLFPDQWTDVYPFFMPADPEKRLPELLELLRAGLKAAPGPRP